MKVLDFGLAKTVGDTAMTQLTMAGTTTGTPGYMAPEIALSEDAIDRRADIYALGCVAYFLLTGTTVFEEENPTRMALLHVQQVPDPPSMRTGAAIPAGARAPGHGVPGEEAGGPPADHGRGRGAAGALPAWSRGRAPMRARGGAARRRALRRLDRSRSR